MNVPNLLTGKFGWGYPYGWAHDSVIYDSTHPNHHKHVKHVKYVKHTKKAREEESQLPKEKHHIFGIHATKE
jgi:hypothetical protein